MDRLIVQMFLIICMTWVASLITWCTYRYHKAIRDREWQKYQDRRLERMQDSFKELLGGDQ